MTQENSCFTSGAYLRHLEYTKLLSNYFIIARTPKTSKFKIRNPVKNLQIIPSLSLNKLSFIWDAFRIGSQICKKNKIDIISCQDPLSCGLAGYLLKRKFGIPLNIHILGDFINNPYFLIERKLNYILNKWAKWIIKKANTIRVNTFRQKENLISQDIDKEKIYCVPAFIDFSSFKKQDDKNIRQLNLNSRFDRIVLSVGRLTKEKSIETVIQAIPYIIKKYSRCLFLIVGGGSQEKYLKRLASNLCVEEFVKFQGPVSYQDIPRYFQAADIFISTSHYEGTCLSILEAAAEKKPIISTPHAGALDALKDGHTGFMVDFDDYISLSKKILYLIENPQVAEEMGRTGRGFVLRRFNKEKILQDYFWMWEATSKVT